MALYESNTQFGHNIEIDYGAGISPRWKDITFTIGGLEYKLGIIKVNTFNRSPSINFWHWEIAWAHRENRGNFVLVGPSGSEQFAVNCQNIQSRLFLLSSNRQSAQKKC